VWLSGFWRFRWRVCRQERRRRNLSFKSPRVADAGFKQSCLVAHTLLDAQCAKRVVCAFLGTVSLACWSPVQCLFAKSSLFMPLSFSASVSSTTWMSAAPSSSTFRPLRQVSRTCKSLDSIPHNDAPIRLAGSGVLRLLISIHPRHRPHTDCRNERAYNYWISVQRRYDVQPLAGLKAVDQ